MWKKPHPLPWEECDEVVDLAPQCTTQTTSEEQVREIFHQTEVALDMSLRKAKKNGLVSSQRGRCSVVKEFWCKNPIQPPKIGRQHDPKPGFMGENMTHVRWLRQLRRLNDMVRLLNKPELYLARVDQITNLWTLIKQAPGFPGGFRHAWQQRSVVSEGDPISIPNNVPSLECATRIRDSFALEFRELEKSLIRRRVDKAKAVRLADSSKIYQDVSKPRPLPVQTIVTKQSATITWVSPEGDRCQYLPKELDVVGATSTVRGLLQIESHTPGELSLTGGQHIEVGDVILQDKWLGNTDDIFKEFAKMWTPLWKKHDHISSDKWEPFVDKCVSLLPDHCSTMQCQDILLEQWEAGVRAKNPKSATGPDGVSRQDLIMMPKSCKVALVSLINQIEQGLPWPRTIMTGLISSLEKHDRAQTVKDYRPICIFSLIYRVWASVRARECLRWLMQFIPNELIGSCPNRQAMDLWYTVSSLVEYMETILKKAVAEHWLTCRSASTTSPGFQCLS